MCELGELKLVFYLCNDFDFLFCFLFLSSTSCFCVLQIWTWMTVLLRGFHIIKSDCFCNSFKFIAKISHVLEFVVIGLFSSVSSIP
ncbi:hypothetical protein PHAVU_010G039850 [Phaseolus vulgaris]